MSGHVDCVARVIDVQTPDNNRVVTFEVPHPWIRYIFAKGYIGLNGASLTVASVDKQRSRFTVWFIPETLRVTTFAARDVGSSVNLEIERSTQVTVDTIRDFLEERLGRLLPKLETLMGELGGPKE